MHDRVCIYSTAGNTPIRRYCSKLSHRDLVCPSIKPACEKLFCLVHASFCRTTTRAHWSGLLYTGWGWWRSLSLTPWMFLTKVSFILSVTLTITLLLLIVLRIMLFLFLITTQSPRFFKLPAPAVQPATATALLGVWLFWTQLVPVNSCYRNSSSTGHMQCMSSG